LVGAVASASAVAQQQGNVQDAVVSNVDSLKASLSGVNYDEEVSQMMTYQHAFSASSRVLTTIDQMLDTLINHTGVVGLS
jgi:flagellar hook-associated protein 1 FlgK